MGFSVWCKYPGFKVLSQEENVFIEESPFVAMTFGGVDPNHFNGKHQYVLVTQNGYWKIESC